MFKQFFINKYFQKLSNTKFFRNDENAIIGKAKDVIKNLQDQIYYVENPHNDIDEENRDFIVEEANSLIEEIQKEYPKVDIKLTNEEKYSIRWHMGFTEPKELYGTLGEAYKKYPAALLLNEADLESTYFYNI